MGVGSGLAVSCLRATTVVKDAATRWALSPPAALAFARHAVHNILYTSFLKGNERVSATVHAGECELTVESGKNGESRGFAAPTTGGDWGYRGVGRVSLVKYLTNDTRPAISVFEYEGGVDEAWKAVAETEAPGGLTTVVSVTTLDGGGAVDWAGGFMVQAVATSGGVNQPRESGASQIEELHRLWASQEPPDIKSCVERFPENTQDGLEHAVSELIAQPLGVTLDLSNSEFVQQDYFCQCNTRDHAALLTQAVGREEIERMLAEDETIRTGGVGLDCHMCNAHHFIPISAIKSRMSGRD